MKKSNIIARLDAMKLAWSMKHIPPAKFIDRLKGPVKKTKIKLAFTWASEEQLNEIRRWPHVVEAKVITSYYERHHPYRSVVIYLDCALYEA